MINIAVSGATGRMGNALATLLNDSVDAQLTLLSRGDKLTANIDVLIDFTLPEATLDYARQCAELSIPMVIGTTGFSNEQLQQLTGYSTQIPICMAANFSIGVNVTLQLLKQAAQMLSTETVDIEIVEAHHRSKVDSPSGTALAMGQVIADELQRDLSQCTVNGREGTSDIRDSKEIGFHAIRGGDIVGEHNVIFAMQGERIEIGHKASNRSNFASGAIRAAHWLVAQPAGNYSMQDLIS